MSRILLKSLAIIFILSSAGLHGQRVLMDGNWEAVILYNSVPFLVKMTPEGKILDFEKELPKSYSALKKYMEEEFGGQQSIYVINDKQGLESRNIAELKEEIDPHREVKVSEEKEMVLNEVMEGQVNEEVTAENDQAMSEEIAEVAEENNVKRTRQSYNFNLVYPGQVAIFNKGQLGRLDEIIQIMKEDNELQLEMEAFASDQSNVSVTVNKNRLQGITDYLTFKGIGEERISSKGMSIDPTKSNTIRIILE